VAAWVKPADSSIALRRIVEHEDNFYFWQQNNAFRYTTHGTGGDSQAVSTTAPAAGTWQHVTAVYRGGEPAEIYVNGVLEDASGSNQVAMANNTQTLQVGARRSSSGSPSNFFNGDLDDVAVWNEALTPGAIAALAGSGTGGYYGRTTPTGTSVSTTTLALWDFEEMAFGGTTNTQRIEDTSGFDRDAFAGGGANTPEVIASSSLYGKKALRFDFDSDVVIFRDGFNGFLDGPPPAGTDVDFGQNDSFTVEAVIRAASDPGSDGAGAIVAKDVGSNQPSWWLRILDDGRLQAIVDDSAGGYGLVTGTSALNDNLWHHVAFVRDAANDEVRLYVDYDPDGTAVDNTVGTSANGNDIRLGGFNAGTRHFAGDIELARISIGALAPSQFIQPIPEPATVVVWSLLVCLALAFRRRRR